jgi:hypothetical protein
VALPARRTGGSLLALVLMLAPAALEAQVRAGLEFQVNTVTTSSQYGQAAAFDREGDFVLVWSSLHTGDTEVRGQRYAANGTTRGGEFQVNAFTTDFQYTVSAGTPVAMRPDGRFVVVWSSFAQDGDAGAIIGQRFDASGLKLGAEFQANTTTASGQYGSSVAVSPHGTFVVVWQSDLQDGSYYGVFGQLFDAGGNRIGAEFQVNSTTLDDQLYPRVAMDAAGGFVVSWQSPDASGLGVFARVFTPAAVPVAAEFRVNVATAGDQYAYSVSSAADGRFVVSWDSLTDGSSYGVFARRFAAGGAPVGGDFLVNTNTTGSQAFGTVAMDQTGNFVAAWHWEAGDGSLRSVQAQRFRNTGVKRGPEVRANTFTTGDQVVAQVASDGAGNFLVSWRDDGARDGSAQGVFAQRFQGLVPSALTVDTAGNGVLEPGESTNVRPLWRNVNGASQNGVTGALSGDTGPGTHGIPDGAATYGTINNGITQPCSDCYAVSVGSPRPATHWDVTALEALAPDTQGQEKAWTLHVGGSFTDVPASSGFYPFIETMLHHAVTGGCAPSLYCAANTTTRQEMAVFVLVAREGALFSPRPCTSAPFADVPTTSGFCPFIAELARRGVAGGCGGGNYCPGNAVTRQEMAVFALATVDPAFTPPACSVQPFPDVATSSPFCPAIAELQRRGVIAGCGGGNFCPASPVTRQEMAVFISGTFGMTLYGP